MKQHYSICKPNELAVYNLKTPAAVAPNTHYEDAYDYFISSDKLHVNIINLIDVESLLQ